VVLRVNSLIEAIVFHAAVFTGFLERHSTIGTTNRAAEGLGPVVDVAKFAKIQPGIASAVLSERILDDRE
jgi:hypothetical protein